MIEVTWGIVVFAVLMAVYTLGWIAGHEHCSRWSQKETLDTTNQDANYPDSLR